MTTDKKAEGVTWITQQSLIKLRHDAAKLPLHSSKIHARQGGAYMASFKGRGMEFDESRLYMPGDDIRNMDWRVTARTGDPHTKVFREERERPAIQRTFEDSEPVLLDIPDEVGLLRRELQIGDLPRGLHAPGRLVVSTQYPVGLFRAWCYVECDRQVLVYPQPGESWRAPGDDASSCDDGGDGNGSEDFAGLRSYVAGDQPSRIDWKSYARDRGLNTRLFGGQSDAPLWIDWCDAPGVDHEARLSALCRAVVDAG